MAEETNETEVPPDGRMTGGGKGISYLRDHFMPALMHDLLLSAERMP